MKMSLAWIFDHIDANWKKQSIDTIVTRFNEVTAEIESFSKLSIDLKTLYLGRVISIEKEAVTLSIPELKQEVLLPLRDAQGAMNFYYLLYKDGKDFRWATCRDVGLEKDGLLPLFDVPEEQVKGWKKNIFESEDIILDIDNKSITHRPDMWGHRGFAREIAAFLDLPFKAKDHFLASHSIKNFEKKSKSDTKNVFSIEIEADVCKRFSGLYFSSFENKPSNLFIASRLIKAGVRPINATVDLTNYVMLDWSQPVHAYDAEKVAGKKLVARMAKKGETLTILDGKELTLIKEDLVIADGEKAVGLAGVMGGLKDSISAQTKSIFFESAHFEPASIRRTAMRHGIRTDSSARFEKTLDPNQITDAILRFISLAKQCGIEHEVSGDIICIGKAFEEKTIGVSHLFLEKRSGVRLDQDDIVKPLARLGFTVSATSEVIGDEQDTLYTVTIPSFRGAKDVDIKEDIFEEVIRFFGYNKIALQLPKVEKPPEDITTLFRTRKLKNFLANSARMMEQQNYFYYDEQFLSEIGFRPEDCLSIKNPVSQNNARLVSSLIPNLFKNIKENSVNENSLRFFEFGRVCRFVDNVVEENKMLSGLFFEKRTPLNFYTCKQYIIDILRLCGMDKLTWKKIDVIYKEMPWVMPYQSAEIFHNNSKVGIIGKVEPTFLAKLDFLPESDMFFFDLQADRLMAYRKEDVPYVPISKFQEVTFDLCFMVPLELSVEDLEVSIFDSDDLIEKTMLVDFFDKADWLDKRSVAFRLWVGSSEKTLQKEEIEQVRNNALKAAEKLGATLRL